MARESCASSACFSARVCSAMARDCSPRANVMRPCRRQSVESCASLIVLAKRVGRAAERRGGLVEIVLQQPRFGERGANRELVFAGQRTAKQWREQLGGLSSAAALQR